MTTVPTPPSAVTPPWQDTRFRWPSGSSCCSQEMTLEEKVGPARQPLGRQRHAGRRRQRAGPRGRPGRHVQRRADAGRLRGLRATSRSRRRAVHGLGHLTRVFGSAPVTAAEGAAELVRQQRVVLEGSRLGIPALVHEECLTGFTTYGATVYPAAIAWGATFDPDLVERMAAAIGRDMAAVGVHQGLSPVLDVVRDYRWGRVEETMGEDPYLVAMLGAAYVRGLQSAGVIATLKHFAGYSASRAARNHGPVPMGRRELMDMILPPFETAVALGGARLGDELLLRRRRRPGRRGPLAADRPAARRVGIRPGRSCPTTGRCRSSRRCTGSPPTPTRAGVLALAAGIDVELPDTLGFGAALVERVRRGELPEDLVDRAARRLLTQKVELGLLDPDWTPGGVGGRGAATSTWTRRPTARWPASWPSGRSCCSTPAPRCRCSARAAGAAAGGRRRARAPTTRAPSWAATPSPTTCCPAIPGLGLGIEVPTGVDALRAELPDVEVVHEPGCDVRGDDRSGFAAALAGGP